MTKTWIIIALTQGPVSYKVLNVCSIEEAIEQKSFDLSPGSGSHIIRAFERTSSVTLDVVISAL